MPYLVTLKAGLKDVALPDGTLGQGGQSYALSEAHYNGLSPTARSTLFSSVTAPDDFTQAEGDTLAGRVTAVELGFGTVNGYITDALNRVASLETRMTNAEGRLNDLETP